MTKARETFVPTAATGTAEIQRRNPKSKPGRRTSRRNVPAGRGGSNPGGSGTETLES